MNLKYLLEVTGTSCYNEVRKNLEKKREVLASFVFGIGRVFWCTRRAERENQRFPMTKTTIEFL